MQMILMAQLVNTILHYYSLRQDLHNKVFYNG